ncbi:MAG: hypothetical protein ACT4N2_07835 [Hyphomicrobium sp.]
MAVIALTETQKQAAAEIGRAQWAAAFKMQFPRATKEEKAASWKQNRKEYVRIGRLAMRQLTKAGFQVTGERKAKAGKRRAA